MTLYATTTYLAADKSIPSYFDTDSSLPSFENTATSSNVIFGVKMLFQYDLSSRMRSAYVTLRQNQLNTAQQIFLGDYGHTNYWFDVKEMSAIDSRLLPTNNTATRTTILFQMAEDTLVTTVKPAYSILGVIEGLGGFAIVLIFVSKFLINGMAQRVFKSELLEKFYQVSRNSTQIKSQSDPFIKHVTEDRSVNEQDMKTVSDTIADRENFKSQCYQWFCSAGCQCCSRKNNRHHRMFQKGTQRIDKDIDLRTYLKNIRNVHLLANTLLNERQRTLLNFQKLKVIDSCSTSESDDRHYEPNVAIKNPEAWFYRKQRYTENTAKMLSGYTQ